MIRTTKVVAIGNEAIIIITIITLVRWFWLRSWLLWLDATRKRRETLLKEDSELKEC